MRSLIVICGCRRGCIKMLIKKAPGLRAWGRQSKREGEASVGGLGSGGGTGFDPAPNLATPAEGRTDAKNG